MSNIQKAFQNGTALIGFVTGGDPSLKKSEEIILEMVRGGTDLVEIGIPFSDPVAEGAVIQAANLRALSAGATTHKIFRLVESLRQKTQVPLVFLTYVNPVLQYGYDRFFARCEALGVDGILLPDLPYEEKGELLEVAQKHGVDLISMIAPTSEDRIQTIAAPAAGFLYIVSSMGVTGMRSQIQTDLAALLRKVRAASGIPAAVGFGINTPEQARSIAALADGVIVGSAIVKLIEAHGDQAGKYVYEYVRAMKEAILAAG